MLGLKNIIFLGVSVAFLSACSASSEPDYVWLEESKEANGEIILVDEEVVESPKEESFWQRLWGSSETEVEPEPELELELEQPDQFIETSYNTQSNVAGVRYCPPRQRCSDGRLPPQPCAQPMPTYYGNMPLEQLAEGVELIHPYTRTKIVCFEQNGYTAQECAKYFQNNGYVLVTDIPQLPANYDFLRKGTYPTRRWRNGGEVVPRW